MKYILILLFCSFFFATETQSQELLPINESGLEDLLAENKGKVLLINFWAYWCQPCREEFPDLMKLKEEYGGENFELVFITLDFGDALVEKTPAFLKEMNVDFTTYYNAFDKDEDLIIRMSENWDGGIPATFIYNKEGELVETMIGKKPYEEFEKAIKELM